jgi:succinate dehydrogenase (ubiquinone) cytochrome b560 subunit
MRLAPQGRVRQGRGSTPRSMSDSRCQHYYQQYLGCTAVIPLGHLYLLSRTVQHLLILKAAAKQQWSFQLAGKDFYRHFVGVASSSMSTRFFQASWTKNAPWALPSRRDLPESASRVCSDTRFLFRSASILPSPFPTRRSDLCKQSWDRQSYGGTIVNRRCVHTQDESQTIKNEHGFDQASKDLKAQRLRRPVSPYMTIYRWTALSLLSALQRNTGLVLSGSMYIFFIGCAVSTVPGLGLTSAFTANSIVAAVASIPVAIQFIGKAGIGWVMALHGINGVASLLASAYPTTMLGGKHTMDRVAWVVYALSGVGGLWLAISC